MTNHERMKKYALLIAIEEGKEKDDLFMEALMYFPRPAIVAAVREMKGRLKNN
jgi:hypothetical protein